jgi:hypothetical protein
MTEKPPSATEYTSIRYPWDKTIALIKNWVTNFGSYRDTILVNMGLLYFLGYVAWSVNAFINNLGLLTALDIQYFLAGVIPAFVLLVTYFAIHFVKYYRYKVKNLLNKEDIIVWKIRAKHVYQFIGLTILFSFCVSVFQFINVPTPSNIIVVFVGIGEFLIFSISDVIIFEGVLSPIFTGLENSSDNDSLFSRFFIRPFNLFYRYASMYLIPISLVGGISFLFFFIVLYPNIPQEFGGVKPRCAFIDIERDKLSLETLENISPPPLSKVNGQISRSIKLDIYYSNNSVLLVKPNDQKGSPYINATFEIDKSIVHSIYWCGQ